MTDCACYFLWCFEILNYNLAQILWCVDLNCKRRKTMTLDYSKNFEKWKHHRSGKGKQTHSTEIPYLKYMRISLQWDRIKRTFYPPFPPLKLWISLNSVMGALLNGYCVVPLWQNLRLKGGLTLSEIPHLKYMQMSLRWDCT
jgi:hypothetical protein